MLCFLQYGCTVFQNPPNSVLKDALEVQMNLTHLLLDELLEIDEQTPELSHIRIDSREYLDDLNGRVVSIYGHLDYRYPDEKEKINTSFHLFLERGAKGESWRLAKPIQTSVDTSKEWMTFPLPIKG